MSALESPLIPIRSEEHELLRARVLAVDTRYAVAFSAPHGRANEHDYIRFALHYYARVLFELVRTARSARDLPMLIERIAATRLLPESDLFALAGVSGTLTRGLEDELHVPEADCVFSSAGHREFHLRGDFSRLNSRSLIGSVIAVIETVVRRTSPEAGDLLGAALANMNASYGVTHRYSEANSLDEVPSTAYHAASFI